MTTFEDLLLKAKDTADAVGQKTTELAEVVRLKTKLAGVRRELAATFEGMGRLVYDSQKSGEDVSELLTSATQRVKKLESQQKKLEDALCRYNKAVRCPHCEEIVPETSAYCNRCGQKLGQD